VARSLAIGVCVAATACGGGSKSGRHPSPSSSTATAGSRAALHPGTSPQSPVELKQRLSAAGINASLFPASQSAQGSVGGVDVTDPVLGDPTNGASFSIFYFRTHADLEAYAAQTTSGVAAGRGLEQIVGNHLYLIARDNGVTPGQRKLFNHVVVVGEGG
jgi:hypothetical protein